MKGIAKLLAAASALALGACGIVPGLDVYDMPVAQAYEKLAALDLEDVEGPFLDGRDVKLTGKKDESLHWESEGNGMLDCTATLTAVEAAKTRVAVSCRSEGHMAGMVARRARTEVIEKIDSTLRDRPYDKSQAGLTASRYPEDVIKHAGFAQEFGQVYADGLKQAAQTQRELAEMQREEALAPSSPPPSSYTGTPHRPGEPTLQLD